MPASFIFLACSFGVGFLVMIVPRIYLEYIGASFKSDYCLGTKLQVEKVTLVSLSAAFILTVLLLAAFKFLYKQKN